MDGFINPDIVHEARRLLDDDQYRETMITHNYELAKRYYSYPILRYGLQTLISNIKYQL